MPAESMRHIVITGASRGLGLSLALEFSAAGDRVFGVSRTRKHWKEARHAAAGNPDFELFQFDLTQEAEVRSLATRIRRRTPAVDVLIHAAGYCGSLVAVEKLALAEFQKTLQENLTSTFLVCKHFLPAFQKQNRGWIINISSMAGQRAVPKLAVYSASKFAVRAISQAVAKENADTDIQCITVCPGGMNTAMRAAIFGQRDAQRQQSPEFVARVIKDVVDGRFPLTSGSEIMIRHGRIASVIPPVNA